MFTPRHIKHSRLLLRHARKYLRYKHDKLSSADREQIVSEMQTLREALRSRDRQKIHSAAETLDKTLHKLTPVTWESHWRENCEVILVAIVIAVGIRSYFLQPFKIPTGSMQPTLNGIIGHPSTEPSPNILRQIVEFVVLGRNYINVVSREDDQIFEIVPKKVAFFFTFSRLVCERQSFLVYASPDTLRQDFNVVPGRLFHRGEVIARGAIDTGDQVFVDKCSYNFVKPHNGDVFVFRTNGIPGIRPDPIAGPPFYIKRLAGLPGDQLRIDPPSLYINGKKAEGYGLRTGDVDATAVPRLCARPRVSCRNLIRRTRCRVTVISPWAITVITVSIAAIGAQSRWRTWSAEGYLFTGRFTRIGDLFVRPMME